jgi:hypothetical protein
MVRQTEAVLKEAITTMAVSDWINPRTEPVMDHQKEVSAYHHLLLQVLLPVVPLQVAVLAEAAMEEPSETNYITQQVL